MTKQELENKVHELRELKRMADEMTAMIEGLQDEIKGVMSEQGVDNLQGTDWKVTWKAYQTSRVDTTALKKALPDLAAQFTKTTTAKRFCVY